MSGDQVEAKSIGFIELGRSNAQSGFFLSKAVKLGTLQISGDQPIDFLFAHAFELMLKGCFLEHDRDYDVEIYGHNILRLYDGVRSNSLLGGLIIAVEKSVRERWKQYLRDARDQYQDKLGLGHLSGVEGEEFGVYGNDVIGEELPELRSTVLWLSERHSNDGSAFRYLRTGLDQRTRIAAFGITDDVVWNSAHWACDHIYEGFRRYRRQVGEQTAGS